LVGKPRRSFSCFGLRDTQNPPSPRVGEGGRGDEGAHAHGNARASLPGTLIRGARASGAHAGGTRLRFRRTPPTLRLRRARGRDARAPGANLRCARPCRGGLVGKPRRAISRFRHQDAQPPPSPRVGEGGRGDEGAHAHGNARASLPRTLPLMRCARLRRARGRDARAPGANLRCARPCRGRFVGKPLRAISRFSHQDAQTPPSPRVGMENAPQG